MILTTLLVVSFFFLPLKNVHCNNGVIPFVLINEVNAFAPGSVPNQAIKQYVELTSGSTSNLPLDNFTLVFFDRDGSTYKNFSLFGLTTYSNGLIEVGSLNTGPEWKKIPMLTNTTAGVALYYAPDGSYPQKVVFDDPKYVLIDAVVYKPTDDLLPINVLLQKLMQGQPLVESTDYKNPICGDGSCDFSLQRCRGMTSRYGPSYVNAPITAGKPNLCPPVNFVINEFHVNINGGSVNEFVEIVSIADPASMLNLTNVTMVVLNENLKNVVFKVALNGYSSKSSGYFTIGDLSACPSSNPHCIDYEVTTGSEFLPAGSCAIAFFYGDLQYEDIYEFNDHLIDAVVYTVNQNPIGELTASFTPGQGPLFLEGSTDPDNDHSVSRTLCCEICNQSLFASTTMTPGLPNDLTGAKDLTPMSWKPAHDLVRINEVLFNQDASSINVTFVELLGHGSVDLTGLVVVAYSANTEQVLLTCSCVNVATNTDGYGVCPCATTVISDIPSGTIGGIVLQYGNAGDYEYANTSIGAKLGFVDSLLYQLSGAAVSNALHKYFAPGQSYSTVASGSKIDISRCYGLNDNRPNWQASFVVSGTVTVMGPNSCPVPQIYINELHFNPTYVELISQTEEFPLDQVNLVYVTDTTGTPTIAAAIVLLNFNFETNKFFTVGAANATDLSMQLPLDASFPSVVAIYFNTTIKNNTVPTKDGLVNAIVYSDNVGTVPEELQLFSSKMYPVDIKGRCSLALCNDYQTIQGDVPTPNMTNQCGFTCQYLMQTVRLNEIHIDVSWNQKSVSFIFVELFSSLQGSVDLTGYSVVFYSAETYQTFAVCNCNGVDTNAAGYATCKCPLQMTFPSTVAFGGAIALQYVDASKFQQAVNVSQGSQWNVVDVVFYQAYGTLVANPLRDYFISKTQQFQLAPPNQGVYSIVRCYGQPGTHGKWQASFTTTTTATKNAPNYCPTPDIYLNEVHFNENFIELFVNSIELPLDQITVAAVTANGTEALLSDAYPLKGQNALDSPFFTFGNVANANVKINITFPNQSPVALVLYWNITVETNHPAPTNGFLSSFIYTLNNNSIVPSSLAPFGSLAYEADNTGRCSLAVCTDDHSILESSPPSIDQPNNCTVTCPGAETKPTLPTTVATSTVSNAQDTGFSYVELSSTIQLNTQDYFVYFFYLNGMTVDLHSIAYATINIDPHRYWVATDNMNATDANFTNSSIVQLVPDGPGAVVLTDNDKYLDIVIYTTDADNTEGIKILQNQFKVTSGYLTVNQSFEPYVSISRCLPNLADQTSFVDSLQTVGSVNKCPAVPKLFVLNFYNTQLDCESATFLPIMNAGWTAVLDQVLPVCNCGLMQWNLNYNNQTKDYVYACISQGVRSTADMFTVDNVQLDRFTTAYNSYLSTHPTILVNVSGKSYSIIFTNGTEISISSGSNKTNVGLIVGLVVMSVVIVIVVAGIAYFIFRKSKKSNQQVVSPIEQRPEKWAIPSGEPNPTLGSSSIVGPHADPVQGVGAEVNLEQRPS